MIEYVNPSEIEAKSFRIIQDELLQPLNPQYAPVILRVIHTTADFDYAKTMTFSPGVIDLASDTLKHGAALVTDTNMVRAGVDEKRLLSLNCSIHCFMKDSDVAQSASKKGITRARAAVDKAASLDGPLIFAVGNAPTALMGICELKKTGQLNPVLVIGVPVGFVNVTEAKDMLISSGIPYITAIGRKGGSNVAAAICNALLRIACPHPFSKMGYAHNPTLRAK